MTDNTATAEDVLILETTKGNVAIRMRPDLAPTHVARIKELVREKQYDGVIFHRVIDGFMAQTGDVKHGNIASMDFDGGKRAGTGGSEKPDIAAEFTATAHRRGTVSMARSQHPHSANSQFFICFADAPWLNKQYTVWGEVAEGMDKVDLIKRGEPVNNPDHIVRAYIAADVAAQD